jgi:hypothetical protein
MGTRKKQNAYGLKLLDGMFDGGVFDTRMIAQAIAERGDMRNLIPAFFFRHPVYSPELKERESIIFDRYAFRVTGAPRGVEDAQKLDRIFARARFSDRYGAMVFAGSGEEVRQALGDDWRVFVDGYVRSHIVVGRGRERITFSLFDFCRVRMDDEGKEDIEIVFSKPVTYLYAFDYLVDHRHFLHIYARIAEMERESGRKWAYACSHLIRYLFSVNYRPPNGVSLRSGVLGKIGFGFLSPENQHRFPLCIANSPGLVNELKFSGIEVKQKDGGAIAYLTSSYIPPVRPVHFIDQSLGWYGKAGQSGKGDHGAEDGNAQDGDGPGKYVVFSTLEITDNLIHIAREFGVGDMNEIEHLFELFKATYSQLKRKYTHRGLGQTWRNFLKKRIGEPEEPVPNIGSPENIVWNDEMKGIWERAKLGIPGDHEFAKFRNYYISVGKARQNWSAAWMNWVMNVKERAGGSASSSPTPSGNLQRAHYLRQRVSAGITKMLRSKGIEPEDVIERKVHVKEIAFDSFPIPPGMGKGNETLFYFVDSDMQTAAVRNIENEGAPSNHPAPQEEGAVEVEVIPYKGETE